MKVLIVSYYWPPSGGSGVQRWLYFTRYLKNLGVQTEVVTIDPEEAAYSVIDSSLTQLVDDI